MIDLASIPSLIRKLAYEVGRRIGLFRGLGHVLTIKAYDERGRLIAYRFVRQKLILHNFKNMLARLFSEEVTWYPAPWSRNADLVDLLGAAKAVAMIGHADVGTSDNIGTAFNSQGSYTEKAPGAGRLGVRIRIGPSTVAPDRADYALGAEVASGIPTITVGVDYIVWAASITLTTGADITEAGLSIVQNISFDGYWADDDFLLFRDTFTAVPVPDGGTISIAEKVTL